MQTIHSIYKRGYERLHKGVDYWEEARDVPRFNDMFSSGYEAYFLQANKAGEFKKKQTAFENIGHSSVLSDFAKSPGVFVVMLPREYSGPDDGNYAPQLTITEDDKLYKYYFPGKGHSGTLRRRRQLARLAHGLRDVDFRHADSRCACGYPDSDGSDDDDDEKDYSDRDKGSGDDGEGDGGGDGGDDGGGDGAGEDGGNSVNLGAAGPAAAGGGGSGGAAAAGGGSGGDGAITSV